jgi:hypothetical protein
MLGVLQAFSVDDSVTLALVAATGFFLAVAFGLLYRYRQASQSLNQSTDLGRDLWEALDDRMKRQDQRIVDLMAKVDVLQARAMNAPPVQAPLTFPTPAMRVEPPPVEVKPQRQPVEALKESLATESRPVTALPASQPATVPQTESQPKPEPVTRSEPTPPPLSTPISPKPLKLDKTSLKALELLKAGPMTTDKLWDKNALNLGREHTSRVMKKLFELGLVTRDDANKPYTYQLTEEGRRYTSQ